MTLDCFRRHGRRCNKAIPKGLLEFLRSENSKLKIRKEADFQQ